MVSFLARWRLHSAFVLTVLAVMTGLVLAEERDILQAIFSSAVVQNFTSFSALESILQPDGAKAPPELKYGQECLVHASNFSALSSCLQAQKKCLTLDAVRSLYSLSPSDTLSESEFLALSPALIFSLLSCDESWNSNQLSSNQTQDSPESLVPSSGASWGYSFLFVTLINMASLTGALVLPCMKLKSYKLVLMFMVALAVGTLAGSGLLFLIPEAFHLVHDDDLSYIWKSSTVMGGIYLFYITEKIMRVINGRSENTRQKKKQGEIATEGTITTSFRRIPLDTTLPGRDTANLPGDIGGICMSPTDPQIHSPDSQTTDICYAEEIDAKISNAGTKEALLDSGLSEVKSISNGVNGHHSNQQHHSHHHHSHQADIAPVAYMIIFGDALHNFIDGLSIGSAFTQSIMTGVSVSVAVLCEELPHELGDFAILLNSGMRFRKAILYNFLSACTCYLGLIIGILLGENTQSHEWIFAIAGGMFLYISLVDMVPEMNAAATTSEGKQFGEWRTFLLQNAGLLVGYTIMLVMALYGGNISFD